MENQLVKAVNQLPQISEKDLIEWLDLAGVGKNISETEKKMFIKIAQISGLNPFKREIYITAYGQGDKRQLSILTGYEVYIRKAEESGLLNGWNVETTGSLNKGDLKAVITIHRKDFANPFKHEVWYYEYCQYKDIWENNQKVGREPNKFWKEKPVTMIKKVAISQGFRMCFNQTLGGMPYTTDEMPQVEDVPHEVIQPEPEKKVKVKALQAGDKISDVSFKKSLEVLKTKPLEVVNLLIVLDLTADQVSDFKKEIGILLPSFEEKIQTEIKQLLS